MVVSGETSAPRSWANWAREFVTSEVSAARPSAADARCTTLLNAPAPSTMLRRHRRDPAGHDRHHGQAHADRADHEQPDDVRVAGVQVDVDEQVGADRRRRQPDRGGPARAELVVDDPGRRHEHAHHERLGQQEQARVEGAEPAGLLQQQRDVEQHGEEADRQHGDQQQRVGVRPVLEHPHVQQRVVDLQLDDHEQGQEDHADGEQDDDRVGGPAPGLALRQRQQQAHQAGGDGAEAEHSRTDPSGSARSAAGTSTAAIVPRMPTGTLMRKISRQSTYSTR